MLYTVKEYSSNGHQFRNLSSWWPWRGHGKWGTHTCIIRAFSPFPILHQPGESRLSFVNPTQSRINVVRTHQPSNHLFVYISTAVKTFALLSLLLPTVVEEKVISTSIPDTTLWIWIHTFLKLYKGKTAHTQKEKVSKKGHSYTKVARQNQRTSLLISNKQLTIEPQNKIATGF